jgi:hypothetical protein
VRSLFAACAQNVRAKYTNGTFAHVNRKRIGILPPCRRNPDGILTPDGRDFYTLWPRYGFKIAPKTPQTIGFTGSKFGPRGPGSFIGNAARGFSREYAFRKEPLCKFAEERKRGDSSGKNSKKSALFSILGGFRLVCLILNPPAENVNPVPLRGGPCAL